jgi:hypothetical protein
MVSIIARALVAERRSMHTRKGAGREVLHSFLWQREDLPQGRD